MTDERPQVIALVGPTAVGKTETVLHLATALPVAIVNADSMQVYRYMDIGTAKPSATERALVPHHLLDLVDPDEDFDAYRYRELGRVAVSEMWRNRRISLVVGGTGLYVKALLHGLFPGGPKSAEIRARLRSEGEAMGTVHLFHRLAAVDPTTAQRIHRHDLVRIIRALEVWECSGRPISAWQREHGFREHPFRVLKIGLSVSRPELYARIDARVERMMAQGLQEEVVWLLKRGYAPELKSMQSLGYRHFVRYVTGRTSLAEALATMKRDTRHYAKRQLTWFGRDPEIHWIHPGERERITRLALAFLEAHGDRHGEDGLGGGHKTVDNAP
ncbi:MAG TPA: tRNA (adenosine(37)-N6)-dimethylallyltransferase MiaA [Syntrophobacteria bacterium]|nr:tRNA (adenosine(37)-N6)-dimethylallyltransferase MiaA [Syntrophobacteria bacterium]